MYPPHERRSSLKKLNKFTIKLHKLPLYVCQNCNKICASNQRECDKNITEHLLSPIVNCQNCHKSINVIENGVNCSKSVIFTSLNCGKPNASSICDGKSHSNQNENVSITCLNCHAPIGNNMTLCYICEKMLTVTVSLKKKSPYNNSEISSSSNIDITNNIFEHSYQKPKLSKMALVSMAIQNLPYQKGSIEQICDWIEYKFPYFSKKDKSKWFKSIHSTLYHRKEFRIENSSETSNFYVIDPTYKNETDKIEFHTKANYDQNDSISHGCMNCHKNVFENNTLCNKCDKTSRVSVALKRPRSNSDANQNVEANRKCQKKLKNCIGCRKKTLNKLFCDSCDCNFRANVQLKKLNLSLNLKSKTAVRKITKIISCKFNCRLCDFECSESENIINHHLEYHYQK